MSATIITIAVLSVAAFVHAITKFVAAPYASARKSSEAGVSGIDVAIALGGCALIVFALVNVVSWFYPPLAETLRALYAMIGNFAKGGTSGF